MDQERGLNHCLNRIRRVLGDDAHTPRFVETVPRQGYRFLAAVEADRGRGSCAGSAASPGTARSRARPHGSRARPLSCSRCQAADAARRARVGDDARVVAGSPRRSPRSSKDAGCSTRGRRAGAAASSPSARPRSTIPASRPRTTRWRTRTCAWARTACSPRTEAFPAARRAALAALAIEDSAEPLVILATIDLNYDWDWAAAERAYRRARGLEPDRIDASLGLARLLSAAGRHDEALAVVNETETRHPGCPVIVRDAGLTHYRARRFDEAARRFRDWAALTARPARSASLARVAPPPARPGRERSGRGAHGDGAREGARPVPEALRRAGPGPGDGVLPARVRPLSRGPEGRREWVTADDFARLRALLGEREHALRDLERAADERSPRLLPYLNDPAFDALRTEARFLALLQRVRVPAGAVRAFRTFDRPRRARSLSVRPAARSRSTRGVSAFTSKRVAALPRLRRSSLPEATR